MILEMINKIKLWAGVGQLSENRSANQQIVDYIRGLDINQNKSPLGYSDQYNWNNSYTLGGYTIIASRMIRGDLIKCTKGDRDIFAYVDQSRQYSFIGWSDFLWHCDTKENVTDILDEIRKVEE